MNQNPLIKTISTLIHEAHGRASDDDAIIIRQETGNLKWSFVPVKDAYGHGPFWVMFENEPYGPLGLPRWVGGRYLSVENALSWYGIE